jgi:hypothetical protein
MAGYSTGSNNLITSDGSGDPTIRYLEAHDRVFAEGSVTSLGRRYANRPTMLS